MKIEIPPYVSRVMNTLAENGFECFIAGGAVRSFLLGAPVHDYDLATNALPEQMKQVFHEYHTIETGIRHGTLTVMSDHHPLEITTYRKENTYSDHRHPDSVEFTSAFREDCARRDFTINGMGADLHGEIYDFFGGREDLDRRIIRCIGSPGERFNEDALRILRALRFAARLDFAIEPHTSEALFKNRNLLKFISMERIREEFTGFLSAEKCAGFMREYLDVFAVFLPELTQIGPSAHQEMFRHLERSADHPLVRMALILEYFPAPAEIMRRMKFSNHETETVCSLIALRDRDTETRTAIRCVMRDLKADFSLYAQYMAARNEHADAQAMMIIHDQIVADHDCYTLRDLAVNGNDLIKAGLRGRQIARGLETALDEVIHERLPNRKDALLSYIMSL